MLQLGRAFRLFGRAEAWPGHSCGLAEEEFAAFNAAILAAGIRNAWFTEENVRHMLTSLAVMLEKEAMDRWVKELDLSARQPAAPKHVGIIMAGNVPMVGFHDLLCVLLSGHRAVIKFSSQDNVLLPAVLEVLERLAPGIGEQVIVADGRLGDVDALIATGSTNTARYFEHYFSHVPRIVRKGRVSVAVLDGSESEEELRSLGDDIFRYFGLGCRNVSKLYFPQTFAVDRFFEAMYDWRHVIDHPKYANNYDYDRAVWLLEQVKFFDNGFVLLREHASLASPVASVFFERYDDRDAVMRSLEEQRERIQVILGRGLCPFGAAQFPKVWDYADDIDTMAFLIGL